jgi:hypothetical protein
MGNAKVVVRITFYVLLGRPVSKYVDNKLINSCWLLKYVHVGSLRKKLYIINGLYIVLGVWRSCSSLSGFVVVLNI